MALKQLYQPLLQYDDEPDFDFFDHLNVDLDQQYHLVALARPATNNNAGDDPEDDEYNKAHNAVVSSSCSLLWSIISLLLLSQFYMPLLLHNYESSSAAANVSWMMACILLFVSTFYVLCHSVDIMMGPTRMRLLMMIVLLLLVPAAILMDLLLLLALWENIEPRLATPLAGSMFITTCMVIMSTRHLLATYNKGALSVIKKRKFGSHVLV